MCSSQASCTGTKWETPGRPSLTPPHTHTPLSGIVHRDIKPQNCIVSSTDNKIKLIDLGAAADLRVGINYAPKEYLLDPRVRGGIDVAWTAKPFARSESPAETGQAYTVNCPICTCLRSTPPHKCTSCRPRRSAHHRRLSQASCRLCCGVWRCQTASTCIAAVSRCSRWSSHPCALTMLSYSSTSEVDLSWRGEATFLRLLWLHGWCLANGDLFCPAFVTLFYLFCLFDTVPFVY